MKRYVALFAVLTLAVCAVVAVFNYRVDPYVIYHFDKANEHTLARVNSFYQLRLIKPWLVVQEKPVAIVVGTSRSATIRPVHDTWPKNQSYNLAIPGQTVYEMLRFIEHAQANGPLAKLMLGFDFEAFVQPEPRVKSGFEEARLVRDASEFVSLRFFWRALSDIRDTLFSIAGLNRSLAAFTGTATAGPAHYKDGTWLSTNQSFSGYGGYIYFAKENVIPLRKQQLDLDANLDVLADILRFAHRQNIDTRLFITPEHIFVIDLWMRLGYSELWNEFHRGLIAVNNAVAEELGVEPFPLYGFNQMPGVVNEPIRRARNAEQSLFTDGSHFRPTLGAQIMTGVWTEGSGIGAKLTTDTVENYLSEIEQMRIAFERDNAKVTTSLRRQISPELQ